MTEVVSHVVILMAKKLQGLEECWRVLFCFPPPVIHRALLTDAWLGVGPPMPGMFSVRHRTKKRPTGPVGLLGVVGTADDPTS